MDEVNALNVYPVPDGDTGTNMLNTMRSAVKYARGCDGTLRGVSAAAAQGALMGARGNSGVILSQVIRGLKEAFAGKETAGVADVRRAADAHVNLIPYNAGPGGFRRPAVPRMERFAEILHEGGVAATLRISRGQDIAAGCGQLKVPEGKAAAV